jgi:micrococcal nuclease
VPVPLARRVTARRRLAPLLAAVLVGLAGCSLPAAPPPLSASSAPPPAVKGDLPVPPQAQEAVVVRVTDGDTLGLRGRGTGPLGGDVTRVRVLLLDTPEVFGEQECYGPEATARAEALVPVGSTVRVQPDEQLLDRYGRTLLHVWNDDGANLGERLVAEGYARVLVVQPNERYLERFRAREDDARGAGRGLWSACR